MVKSFIKRLKQRQSTRKKASKFSSDLAKIFLPLDKLIFMPSVSIENKQKKQRERKIVSPLQKMNLKPGTKHLKPEDILKNYQPLFGDNNSIIINAQQGVGTAAVTDFAIMSGKSQKEIAELIHTTAKTLQNYSAGSKRLPMLQSELLLKLFALYDKGLGIFDGVESFNGWLQAPAFGLYNEVPETLLTTSTGINLVMDELIRIEYGDFA